MSEQEEYYLRSILRQLQAFKERATAFSLETEALADNIDWLDCYIEKHTRSGE